MSALEVLEKNVKLDQHLASHDYAERVFEHALDLIHSGVNPCEVREAVWELHRRARETRQVVERDAYVEVLDALNEEYPSVVA